MKLSAEWEHSSRGNKIKLQSLWLGPGFSASRPECDLLDVWNTMEQMAGRLFQFIVGLQRLINIIDYVDNLNSLTQKLMCVDPPCCYSNLLNGPWPLLTNLYLIKHPEWRYSIGYLGWRGGRTRTNLLVGWVRGESYRGGQQKWLCFGLAWLRPNQRLRIKTWQQNCPLFHQLNATQHKMFKPTIWIVSTHCVQATTIVPSD